MNKRRLIITSVISIILVSILLIGSTYSVFTTSDIDEELNVYKTGNLDITYTLDSENVVMSDKIPHSIEEANMMTPYRITVTNNGTVPYMFDLTLVDTTAGDVVDYRYIMIKVGYLEPKSLDSCVGNVIKEDIILPAGESVSIDVRVWISDTLQNIKLDTSFYAKLKVDGIAVYDKNEEIDNDILSLNYMNAFSDANDTSYFHSSTYQNVIKNVSFVNYIDTTNSVESWDISDDKSVIAWVEDNETEGYYDLYIGSGQMIYAKDLSYYFYEMSSVSSIDFSNLDTSFTDSTTYMFYSTGASSTEFTLDLGDNFNTSKVTDIAYMFYETGYSSTVFTLDLGDKFDTSNVTDMSGMFINTGVNNSYLVLDLSGFTFDNVTTYENMFSGFSDTQIIYVADTDAQTWILDKGFENLSTSNVLVKS